MLHSAGPESMYLLNWEQFTRYWENIGAALRAMDFYDYYTDEWLFNGVYTNQVQVFVLTDGAIRIVLFTQLLEYPKCKVLRLFWGYGCEIERFLKLINERLDDVARIYGATRIEVCGRPGWYRLLRRHIPEAKEGWCTVWRNVKTERVH